MDDSVVTIDHEEIRGWIEERGGVPVQMYTVSGEPGVLKVIFGEIGEDFEEISWDEFFDRFESERLAFQYVLEPDTENIQGAWNFLSRSKSSMPADESELPEENEMAEENMFSDYEPFDEPERW